jgi:hypothetical protein
VRQEAHFHLLEQQRLDHRLPSRYAQAAGLTREQAVRVYSFETGGTGNHDMQSGYRGPGSRAISTAIGYNQLLTTNSVELLAEQGHEFIKELTARAATLSGAPRKAMDQKLAVLKKMVAFARTVPDTWSEHEKLANTAQGWAVHAMVLDIDVGPMLQTHKLLTSVIFARAKGYTRPLTAAELEMMNLTGDGTGLDMVTMPLAMREQVPTSNFFQRGGYERNPVAIRHNTVAKLLAVTDARMDSNSNNAGAKELAAFQKLKTAKDLSFQFLVCDAKPFCGVMVAKRITPKHKPQLTELTGGGKRFLKVGTCHFEEGKFIFTMEDPVVGLARKLQASIKQFTGKKLPIRVGSESADADEEPVPGGAAASAPAAAPGTPSVPRILVGDDDDLIIRVGDEVPIGAGLLARRDGADVVAPPA